MSNKNNSHAIVILTSLILLLILISSTAASAPVKSASSAAPYAYITDTNSNNVSIIDTVTNNVTATVPVGNGPWGVAINPTRAYVTNGGSGTVSIIDTATNNVTATVRVGDTPHGVAATPDGKKVYVANCRSNNVSVIDAVTNTVTTSVKVGVNPNGVAVNPTGTNVYVANFGSGNVSVINTTTNNVTATVKVGANPNDVAVNPAGTKVYVTNYNSNTTSVIDTSTNTVIATVKVGHYPTGLAVSPDGKKVYLGNNGDNTVSVIETATDSVTATVNVGVKPNGVAVTPDGAKVYVVNSGSNTVSVINTLTNTVSATVSVGKSPFAFGQFISSPLVVEPVLPVAKFSTSETEGLAPLSVQFNDYSENANEWSWDFGDGATSTEQNPEHTYSAADNYIVNLKVSNANGTDSSLSTIKVTTILPVANFSSIATSDYVPRSVQFTDLSKNATEWLWDFGDGASSTEQSPMHTYFTTGIYTVNLIVSNANGTDSKLATINVLQTPNIYWYTPANITYGTALSAIQLNAMAINPNTGATVDGTFVYTPAAGTVLSLGTQTLHVDFTPTDTVNYNTASADVQINVKLVLANFIANQTMGFAPLSVQFTDLSENAEAVTWDFGDGNNSADRNPIHEFTTSGTYIVNLNATNGTDIDSKFATINVVGHSGGPDNYNYTFKDSDTVGGPTYDWIEISGTGNQILNNSDDSVKDTVDLGFFFSYYGTDYSRLAIANNGLLFSSGTGSPWNEPIGQSPDVHGFISPFWDDLVTYNGGKIYYQTLGTTPNRIFVTEWIDNQHFPSSDSGITFESILYEGSNNIKFQYKDVSFGNISYNTSSQYDDGGSATVGIENPEGTDGLQYSFNGQVIDSGKAILFVFPQFIDDPGASPSLTIANFSSNITSGSTPLDVQFTDLSENATGWSWDFGDRSPISAEQNPTHTYFSAGNYTVKLTVTNENDTNSTFATINVLTGNTTEYTVGPISLAMDNSGHSIEAHVENGKIVYRAGKVDFDNRTIDWGENN